MGPIESAWQTYRACAPPPGHRAAFVAGALAGVAVAEARGARWARREAIELATIGHLTILGAEAGLNPVQLARETDQ